MTQNNALSTVAVIVIAAGFLVGWCAGAVELGPARIKSIATIGVADRSTVPAYESSDARAHPVRSGSTARDSL